MTKKGQYQSWEAEKQKKITYFLHLRYSIYRYKYKLYTQNEQKTLGFLIVKLE